MSKEFKKTLLVIILVVIGLITTIISGAIGHTSVLEVKSVEPDICQSLNGCGSSYIQTKSSGLPLYYFKSEDSFMKQVLDRNVDVDDLNKARFAIDWAFWSIVIIYIIKITKKFYK